MLKRLVGDLERFAEYSDDAAEWLSLLDGRIHLLFDEEDAALLRSDFVGLDTRVIRAASLSKCIPPLGYAPLAPSLETARCPLWK